MLKKPFFSAILIDQKGVGSIFLIRTTYVLKQKLSRDKLTLKGGWIEMLANSSKMLSDKESTTDIFPK